MLVIISHANFSTFGLSARQCASKPDHFLRRNKLHLIIKAQKHTFIWKLQNKIENILYIRSVKYWKSLMRIFRIARGSHTNKNGQRNPYIPTNGSFTFWYIRAMSSPIKSFCANVGPKWPTKNFGLGYVLKPFRSQYVYLRFTNQKISAKMLIKSTEKSNVQLSLIKPIFVFMLFKENQLFWCQLAGSAYIYIYKWFQKCISCYLIVETSLSFQTKYGDKIYKTRLASKFKMEEILKTLMIIMIWLNNSEWMLNGTC